MLGIVGDHRFCDVFIAAIIDHGDPMTVVDALTLRPNLFPNHVGLVDVSEQGLSVRGGIPAEINAFFGVGDVFKDDLVLRFGLFVPCDGHGDGFIEAALYHNAFGQDGVR